MKKNTAILKIREGAKEGSELSGPGSGRRGEEAGPVPLLLAGALFTLCYCLHLSQAVQC